MSDEPRLPEMEAEHRRLVGAPLDPGVLGPVIRGDDRHGTWELRDGPHPVPQDPDAVRHELIARHPGRGVSIFSGIGARVSQGQIGLIGTAARAGRHENIGYLYARCVPSVATVRIHYQDGAISELPTNLSPTTGERWAVCALDSASIAARVEFLDERGAVLSARAVQDPRTNHEPE